MADGRLRTIFITPRTSPKSAHARIGQIQVPGDGFDLAKNPEQVPAPELGDLLLGVSSPDQLSADAEGLNIINIF
jgi:hypothetical protein